MSESSSIINIRKFIVKGQIECSFTPDSEEFIEEIPNLEIELWQKSPLEVFFLGKGVTDSSGNFTISFGITNDAGYLNEDTIENVFGLIYYRGELISGENPYTEDTHPDRPIRNITLREGLTDIGSHIIDVTRFEYFIETDDTDIRNERPGENRNSILFDVKESTSGKPLPTGSICTFRLYINADTEYTLLSMTSETTKEGYAELIVPQFPVAVKKPEQEFIINLSVNGIPETFSQEYFLRLNSTGVSDYYYTPITNLVIYDGKLSVYSQGIYYSLEGTPSGLETITAFGISESGGFRMYDAVLEEWSAPQQFMFYQFQFPENLDKITAGIYEPNSSTGTIISGELGTGTFEQFSMSLENPGVFQLNIGLTIHVGEREVFDGSFLNLLPGSKNFVMVETNEFPSPADTSPTIDAIETISGISFSTDFIDFLESNELSTINKIRQAGPIRYIDGFSPEFITGSDLNVLQGHVDLYTVNTDANQNQYLIDEGYDNLYKIAETPKDIFLNALESEEFPLYHAAKLHDTVIQNQKLLTNLLSAKMVDYELQTPFIPDLLRSDFPQKSFSKFIDRCECEDCTSAVSPFSYLVDLLRYGAKHIKKTGSPSYNPVDYNAFITLLENYFFQPFGSFDVDCETLHKEYCRMRLVTEILEQYVATKTLPVEVAARLETDRRHFILLTYKTLLTQAGTSYEELRAVISIQDEDELVAAAGRLSDKLGIPLYIYPSDNLTVKRMWMMFDNIGPYLELNAENLELVFGFRDTQREVLSNTPVSEMDTWKEAYLLNLWKQTDYLFSAYSREHVVPSVDSTFKPEWKPIIDPDSFGRSDMTYESSAFALDLWRHRKADTDTFLSYFVSNNDILSRTSADMLGRILRVPGKNLNGINFQNDEIFIQDPSDNNFVAFKIYNTVLAEANTDIILKKSTPETPQTTLFQPQGEQPVMRYGNRLNLITEPIITSGGTSVQLVWESPVILNYLSGGYVELISNGSLDIYSTEPRHEDYLISNIVISSDKKTITFKVNTPLSNNFIEGNITFIYTAEVVLDTSTIPDPEKTCDKLFETDFYYYYLPIAPIGMIDPFAYKVWNDPITWPGTIGTETTYYKKLKKLYEVIRSGTTDEAYLSVITDNLHTDMYGFNLVMEMLISCEQYLNSMYTYDKPDTEKLYQMASVFRNSARKKLNANWIKEEIRHISDGSSEPERLMLDSRYFWKPLSEPQSGIWDGSLQTIPNTTGEITASNIPIIDPELVPFKRLLTSPDAEVYRTLYHLRQEQLNNQRATYFSWVSSYQSDGFQSILNHINTGDQDVPYDLGTDYEHDLNKLISDFESTDVFLQLRANKALESAFSLTRDAFSLILPIMDAYQNENPVNQPSIAELHSVTDLFVTACKKQRFYFTHGMMVGWIAEEVSINFPDPEPLKYYNVLDMRLDPVRGSVLNRSEWQRTLTQWNRIPTIFPDIVPPENINRFVQGETVHDLWVNRKNTLDMIYNQSLLLFNDTLPTGTLFQNLKDMLSTLVARTRVVPSYDYYKYLTALFEKEDAGEDIRPYLNQLNIQIAEYQKLRQVYEILENGNVPLLPSEYEDVINISIHINFANAVYFDYLTEEYYDDIILTGEDFQNYTPSIINFPLNLVQETIQWRSPNADKKAWKDKLNTRIERKKQVLDEWQTTIEETEDITLSVMRDGLIQALRNNCESFDTTAERIAKTLFIETKDNCCVKHSRISHAIETLQGLIFSLENGTYDNYLSEFSLTAPNFNREWEWLGSYGTWRSAVFTYIYPENLLYPTLKRRQSPAFIELAETIQNANRFTSVNACQAAKKYQEYLEDIQNLKVSCTANANAYVYRKDPLDCCGDLNHSIKTYMTFYIAQSTVSGKSYYSEKPYYVASSDEHDFWKVIPTLRENVKIIGCLPLSNEYDSNGDATNLELWLYFTYKENNTLKLAYIKKDLMVANSEWTEEEEVELPNFDGFKYRRINGAITPILNVKEDKLIDISICQNSAEWDYVYFIFSYYRPSDVNRHVQIRYEPQTDIFHLRLESLLFFDNKFIPITATKQLMGQTTASNPLQYIGITVVFNNEIQTGVYGNITSSTTVFPIKHSIVDSIGAFKMSPPTAYPYDRIVVANRDTSEQTKYFEFTFTYNGLTITQTHTLLSAQQFHRNVLSIAPTFNQTGWEGGSAVTYLENNGPIGNVFKYASNHVLEDSVRFALTPQKNTVTVPIVSGECIDDFNLRTATIKKQLTDNLNAPMGNPVGNIYRTSTIKEVLYEAYYFVPMLIALDQQQRGDYPTALDWYRSVYDYTNNLVDKRKIFYGLTLEESITNVIERPADWLLDPLNPHLIAQTRTNAYTKYTLMNIIQCMISYGDREFTIDTIETVPNARKLYTEALDLMKVKELNIKPSKCYTASHNCFQTAVDVTIDFYWENSFSELQRKLENLDNVALIEETTEELADIFNGEGTMQEKFTAAFTYLSELNAFSVASGPEMLSALINGIGERMNDAYRYLFANVDTQPFNTAIEAHFTNALATLTFQTPEEISQPENAEKISWLKAPVTDNAQPFAFRFIDSEGNQLLRKELAFDPLQPAAAAFQANLVYANADVLYPPFLYERDFIPFIDYTFCLPSNPVYSSLELKANLELFKIQNCRNIAGMERSLDIFAAPTDSVTGVPIIGAGGNLVLPGTGAIIPSQYRFRVLIERAKLLVSQAQQLESQFLAALEKEDAENYSQLRARQDLQTAKSTVKLQDMRVKQALNEEIIADLQLDKMQFVQDTYNDWLSTGIIGLEHANLILLAASASLSTTASATAIFGGGGASGIFSNAANAVSTTASIMSQLASYQRRAQEWQYQSDLARYDISIANQQIKIAEQNTRIVSQEREIATLNMDHATDTLEFLKTKFTNAELYRWMGNVLERTYSYMLSLAASVAKTAEQQYYFEQQQQAGPFILNDYWEVPQTGSLALTGGGIDRRGLTGSARLLQDITKLDQYAFETTKRKLQMTKVISLGQLYPDAFQTFRQTGVLNFDLTNRLFDYDFPGHYLRLINGVKVSVIGLVPVYDNIKATLTAGTTSYTVINANNTFQQVPIRRMEMDQIALTGASRATGVFEFQAAQGELLNPFEGMGIESRWEFKMPKFSNRMDYTTIADVLIEVDYTALDSFQYRYLVLQDIDNTLGFSRGFSFKNDYPDQWYELAQVQESSTEFSVEIELKRNQFPQGIDGIRLDGSNLLLHFVRKDGFTNEVTISDFSLVSTDANAQPMSGVTVNGTFNAVALTNVLSTQTTATPFVKLRLAFANTALNRELFSQENVTDILLLVSCKADLPVYPL